MGIISQLKKRVNKLENKILAQNKIFIVMVQETDKSPEAALERVMQERGLVELPESWIVITIDMHNPLRSF